MKHVLLTLATLVLCSVSNISLAHDEPGQKEPQMKDANIVVWFEIPVIDMDRAVKFYNSVLAIELRLETKMVPMAFFPAKAGYGSGGALIKMEVMKPGVDGPLVYLNGGEDLNVILDRVVPAGGSVLVPKTEIPEVGYFATFKDTEGNRIGLFSGK